MADAPGRADDLRRAGHGAAAGAVPAASSRAAASPPSRVAWCGDVAEGERCSRRCARRCPPALDLVGPMPYVALQSMLDETAPHGWQLLRPACTTSPRSSDGFIDDAARRLRARADAAGARHDRAGWAAPIDRVAARRRRRSATAARARSRGSSAARATSRSSPVTDWVRDVWEATRPFATGGVYVNALDAGRPVARRLRRRRLGAPRRRSSAATTRTASSTRQRDRRRSERPRARRARPPRRGCARRACEHAADVVLGGLRRDHEPLGDLGVREARRDQARAPRARARSARRARRARRCGPATPRSRSSAAASSASRARAEALEGVARRARRGERERRAGSRPGRARAPAAPAPPRAGSRARAKPATASSSARGGRPASPRASGDAAREQRRLGAQVLAREPLAPRSRRRCGGDAGAVEVARRERDRAAQREQLAASPPRRARSSRARASCELAALQVQLARAARSADGLVLEAREQAARPPRVRPWRSRSSASTASGSARPPPRRAVGLARAAPRSSTASARAQSPARTSTRAVDRAAPRLHRREAAALGELDDRLAPLARRAAGRRGRRRRRASCSTRRRRRAGRSSRRRARRSSPRRAAPTPSSTRPWRDDGAAELRERHALDVGVGELVRDVERRARVPLGRRPGRPARLASSIAQPAELGDRARVRRAGAAPARASRPRPACWPSIRCSPAR